VFEQSVPLHAPLQARQMDVLTPQAKESYLYARNLAASRAGTPRGEQATQAYKNDLGLERQFVAAGGLLLAGPDPTGNGGVIPGFGDQREVELLVEAGFTPLEAIRIATLNGAAYLGLADRIGSIAPGKTADLVLYDGRLVLDWVRDDESTGEHVAKTTSVRYMSAARTAEVTSFFDAWQDGDAARRTVRADRISFLSADELVSLADAAGLRVDQLSGGYEMGDFAADGDRVVMVCRKFTD
jgi:hypothetical protein